MLAAWLRPFRAPLYDGSPSCFDEGPGAVLEARIDAVDDQERRPDQFLGRRKDVEEHRLVDGLAREVGQHDQLAGLEELLAVLGEDELHDVVAQALAGQAPGQGVVGELAVRRIARLPRLRHDELDRRAFDHVPFLPASSASRAAVVMKSLPSSVTR